VKGARIRFDESTGETIVDLPGIERLARIGATWKTARMWVWMDDQRLRIDLEPKAGPIADLLRHWKGSLYDADDGLPRPPSDAAVWLAVPGKQSSALLAQLVHHLGIDVPGGLMAYETQLGSSTGKPHRPGPVLAWGTPAIGTGYALTITIAGDGLPLGALALPMPAEGEDSAPLLKGAAPITRSGADGPAPAGEVRTRRVKPFDVVAFGAEAGKAIDRAQAHLTKAEALPWPQQAKDGFETIARFGATTRRAAQILGRALQPGGVFAAVGGGAIRGSLSTNGKIVRLEARVSE